MSIFYAFTSLLSFLFVSFLPARDSPATPWTSLEISLKHGLMSYPGF